MANQASYEESQLIRTLQTAIVNALRDCDIDPVLARDIAEVQAWSILNTIRKESFHETESA